MRNYDLVVLLPAFGYTYTTFDALDDLMYFFFGMRLRLLEPVNNFSWAGATHV